MKNSRELMARENNQARQKQSRLLMRTAQEHQLSVDSDNTTRINGQLQSTFNRQFNKYYD